MLDKVEVRTDQGTLLTLLLEDISEGFVVEDIPGLDPVKATLVSSGFAQLDGTQHQASRRESRTIQFKLKMEPDYALTTVGQLRSRLMSFFMPKSIVNMRFFHSEFGQVDIQGRVEDFDAPQFVQEPRATITVFCNQSDFVDITPVTFNGNTTSGTSEVTLNYPGSVESGMQFKLMPNRTIGDFTIYLRRADGSVRLLEFVYPMVSGDVLDISTIPRAKGAYLTRASAQSSVLYGVSPYSDWLQLYPGENLIRVFADGTPVPYSITYTKKYGGL